jgi:putative phosphoesterase
MCLKAWGSNAFGSNKFGHQFAYGPATLSRRIADLSTIIGLISDTHGLLRPAAVKFLRGCTRIVHAGDIGDESVLDALERIAPTTAIKGNSDCDDWAAMLPDTVRVTISGKRIFVAHSLDAIYEDWKTAGYDVVVTGHTHIPEAKEEHGVLFINPGSAGPIRPGNPVSIGRLIIDGNKVDYELMTLT